MIEVRRLAAAVLLVVVALVGAAMQAPLAHAQAGGTLAPADGAVQGDTYTLSAAGLSFDLPATWVRSGYRWNEYWGTAADARVEGASYLVEWVYSPAAASSGPGTLLTLAVFRAADWEGSAASVVAESAEWVVAATLPENPYAAGSAEAERFEGLSLTWEEVEAAVSLSGGAEASDEPPGVSFLEPDLWCAFSGTGATITVNGQRVNFDCETEDGSTVVLVGDVTLGEEGWELTRATIVRGEEGFEVEESTRVLLSHIELEDGTLCAEAGTGATFGVEGERVNYTCEEEGVVLAGDIEQTEEGWEILKGRVALTEDGWETLSSEMALIARVGVTELNAAATARVTGTVTYLPRIALPENAGVTVQLVDISRADAPAVVLDGLIIITGGRQVPFPFELFYDPSAIEESHMYAVQASIRVDGELWFTTTEAHLVITQGHPTEIEVVLDPVR